VSGRDLSVLHRDVTRQQPWTPPQPLWYRLLVAENQIPEIALRAYYDHYMKLLDLFETRQTWAFNFALVVYAGAVTAAGGLSDKLVGHRAAAAVLTLSVALPLLVLPVCLLYVDVSVYCAALNLGNLENWTKLLCAKGASPDKFNLDPGSLAFGWLKPKELGVLHWIAHLRMLLFFVAPVAGLVAVVASCVCRAPVPRVLSWVGAVVSSAALAGTSIAFRTNIKIRTRAHEEHKTLRTVLTG